MTGDNKIAKLFEKAQGYVSDKKVLEAKKICRKIIKLSPLNYSGNHLLGLLEFETGHYVAAIERLKVVQSQASNSNDYNNITSQLCDAYIAAKKPKLAIIDLEKIINTKPDDLKIKYKLSQAYHHNKQYDNSIMILNGLIEAISYNSQFHAARAQCYYDQKDYVKALMEYQALQKNHKEQFDYLIKQSECLIKLKKLDKAKTLLENYIAEQPKAIQVRYNLALIYRSIGELTSAQVQFETILTQDPSLATVYYNYARIKKFELGDEYIEKMELCLNDLSNTQINSKIELLFALGKVAEDVKDYDKAFAYWSLANKMKSKQSKYDIKEDLARYREIQKVITPSLLKGIVLPKMNDIIPIFIVSMPRAGSTLVEQILSSHSKVLSVGESMALPNAINQFEVETNTSYPNCLESLSTKDYTRMRNLYLENIDLPAGQKYFLDKLPGNFWTVGLIKVLFPNAIIINTIRNKMDTCFSCYKHLFSHSQAFSYNFKHLLSQYSLYENMMNYWHDEIEINITDVIYEDLVQSSKQKITELLAICELEVENACFKFYENKKAVSTASAAQVRQPMYLNAINHWHHYESLLTKKYNISF